ncbi:MAG: ATP-binding cassette domain-containing protein [Firmicutes bacterium]|nr:ATP-binding cassette domain-containing protein [Bacillota bacterium]
MDIVEVVSLTRKYGSFTAVKGLSFQVREREVFGLVGPNGAGKTTTIRMLTTLLPPSGGRATLAGYDVVRQASQVRRVIGYVPQVISADGSLTGYENLLVFAKLYDVPGADRMQRVEAALDFMGLSEAAGTLVRHYSGGMIRRLEIAQSMMHRPKVLFMDEPTVGLDPVARKAVWDHIRKLRQEYGTTIFATTHYMEEADNICDRVAIMHHGQVAALGSPAELKSGIGIPDATLDDVFTHYTGDTLESGGNYRETLRVRRTARRLG